MGSTLEILSQFWASICGGYFFDPHQNTFCNAIHLYLWLFLLVTPFVSFLYFPEALTTWGLYVLSTLIVITVVKLLNLALHVMYDEAQIVSDTSLKKSTKNLRETPADEDGGIEMQVLGDPSSRTSAENNISNDISQANSAISIDFPEQIASTIDLKVDVHRKNSSESSESIGAIGHSQKPYTTSDAPLPQEMNRRSLKIKSKSEETPASMKRSPTSDDSDIVKAEEVFDQIRDIRQQQKARLPSKYRRQLSIHSEQTGMGLVFCGDSVPSLKLQRHRSSEAHEEHRHNRNQGFYHKNSQQLQSVPSDLRYYIRADEEKHKLGLNQSNASMRKDSNSTMSAIQLPTASGPSSSGMFSSSSRLRRHSTTTGKPSMRRIKSAALETCCAQPSVSNLSAHPNSVETIGGQTLINPQHAMLPPPSKSLIRNQHSNLYSKDTNSSSSCTNDNTPSPLQSTSQTIEPVYPIAEQADERCTNECFLYNSGSDDDDDDDDERDDEDELPEGKRQRCSTTSESDIERPPTQSTDSDTENNGSRSPLLDIKTRNDSSIMLPPIEKKNLTQPEKLKKSSPSQEEAIATANVLSISENAKGEDSGCPSSDCDQASASSKDLLLTQDTKEPKKPSERMWFDFSMDSNNICVDVTDPGEGSSKMITGTGGKEHQQKSLGAIPKTSVGATRKQLQSRDPFFDQLDEIMRTEINLAKMSSRTSSAASSSRCSGASYEYERPPIDVLHETSDGCGWILQSALTNPILAAARGDPPPLLPVYNSRQSSMFPVTRPSGTYFNHTRHHPPMIRRETRNRPQNASFDTTVSSRDDETSPRVVSGWEYDNLELQHSINADILLKQLMEHNKTTHLSDVVQQAEGSIPISIGGVEFSESVFREYWRHYSLPLEKPVQPKRFYKFPFHCFGKRELKISMDRLQLLALFDRDLGWFPAFLAIVLASMVSILGAIVLRLNIYKDIFAFIFCFVIAGSQYSLLKSVQPDAASPVHGFNKTVAYSRPIYFILCSSLLILANHLITTDSTTYETITLFNIPIVPNELFRLIQYMMSMIMLMMPIFFSLGLFPQINTFLIYMLEQIDMHLLGGNAVCSLLSAFLGVLRSIFACFILYGPVFGGLSEPRGSQHILFSIFCALLIAISYHLSRSASDFSCIWSLIKSSLFIHTDDDDDEKEPSNETEQVDIDHKKSDSENQPVNAKSSDSDITNKDCDLEDPLPRKLQSTVNSRLKNDFLVCIVMGCLVFSLHCTTVFTVLQPELLDIICKIAAQLGFILHYFVPQMRKHLPWLCVAQPVLKQNEFGQFEARKAAKVMWFEKTYVCMCFFERNILYPLLFLSALTENSTVIVQKFGVAFGAAIIVICGLKCVRSSYSDPSSQYVIVLFSVLLFGRDFTTASETFLLDYFIIAIIYKKISEFLLKLQFIVTYIAPWQITWGSAFHAFAQPFSVPHSAMLFLQAGISALLSTPLNPFLGSAIFLTSYVRPIKFWERDYNTRRIDHSNTRLVSQLERDLGADDNNLNSIFYEHLTRSLQHSLCGDLLLGRWGNVSQGDCFVLASDYLNCLVHIIELGNGLCTFQMRGLEFRGTYCQQREVEAISEGVEENEGCCCCSPGHIPHLLSINAMFSTRWLAWQVVQSKYILEGYSISDNLAQATLQVFEFRRVLITYYIKSIIFYTIRSPKLEEWLESSAIQDSLQHTLERQFVDLDPIFNHNLDADFENRASGITRASFCDVYMEWIEFCCMKRAEQQLQQQQSATATTTAKPEPQVRTTSSTNVSKGPSPWSSNNPTPSPREHDKPVDSKNNNVGEANNRRTIIHTSRDSPLISLLLALGLLARRTLATASNSSLVTNVEFFLHGLHALFKGDFRITSPRDEWVFADMDLLHSVVAPAVKMALKLHQDHFLSPEEYDEPVALYDAITTHTKELVISHEADPLWRNAVLRGAPNLLALRHVMEDGSDEYRLIRLTKRFLSFRVIKLNRECVRGLWAGQQQELIYLRNRNPERGSIQNAKQALRNIINSSCDQPIGYPIYVSPLTTSYAETNEQLCNIIGGAITLEKIHKLVVGFCQRVRQRCREGCSSGSATLDTEVGDVQGVYCNAPTPNNTLSGTTGTLSYGSQSLSGAGNRGSLASMGKPTNSALFANLLNRERERDRETERESLRERGTKRRSSGIGKTERDHDRRATLPAAAGSSDRDLTANVKDAMIGDTKGQQSSNNESSYVMMTSFLKPNSSYSSGHLGASNTRNVSISMDRKSKSEERQSSRERVSGADGEQSISTAIFPAPFIEYHKKVIIVDSSEIYDCLDLGRRIDVVWPNEMMRLCGGRSSWGRDWTPQEGMVGYVVHYWVPNHPNLDFRSNFNRTLFLIQIGDKFVPVGENGVKEYNTVGSDERIKIVHMPKEELKLDTDEHEILEEKSEDDSAAEDYVLSAADHSV